MATKTYVLTIEETAVGDTGDAYTTNMAALEAEFLQALRNQGPVYKGGCKLEVMGCTPNE
jgi:hypothetical protein